MCADICRKVFTDPEQWEHACKLINIISPDNLKELVADKTKSFVDRKGGKVFGRKANKGALTPVDLQEEDAASEHLLG